MAKPWRRDLKVAGIAAAAMAVFAVLALVATDLPVLRRIELTTLDLRLRLRGPLPPGPEVAVVLVDDRSLAELGRWPLPRDRYAELVERLHEIGARVIAFDLLFADRGRPRDGDLRFAEAIRAAGNVVLPFSFRTTNEPRPASAPEAVARSAFASVRAVAERSATPVGPATLVPPVAPLADAAAALGLSLIAYDVDGAPRHEHLAMEYDLDHYPSLALRVVQMFHGVPWPQVRLELGRGVAVGDGFLATDRWMRSLINYRGPRGSFPTYSLIDVLNRQVPAAALRDRVVLVGASIGGINDALETPFSAVMPGVERLATAIDNLLHDSFLHRPAAVPAVEAAVLLLLAALIGVVVSRFSALTAILFAGAAMLAWAMVGHAALLLHNLWLAAALPLAAVPVVFAATLVYRHLLLDREHQQARTLFARYLAPDMVERLMQAREMPRLGGEERPLTVLFCDIRGFAALSERLPPDELTRIINDFFTAMTDAILEHGGTIDKYIGDAVMAFWNAPLDQADHAERACHAALAMLDRLAALNRSLSERGAPPLAVGIGVNSGPCVVGNFGSRHRFDYSALGDTVNVAARLEVETKRFGLPLLIGPDTAAAAASLSPTPIGHIRLRGRSAVVKVFTLGRVADQGLRVRSV